MSVESYTISQLFDAVWGLAPAYTLPGLPSYRAVEQLIGINNYKIPAREDAPEVSGIQLPESTETRSRDIYPESESVKSKYGTEAFFPFWLGGEELKYFDEITGELKQRAEGKFLAPIATLIDETNQKEIVRTKISGGKGTVKELYTFGDSELKIRGLLIDEGENGRTAIELRRKLAEFARYADSIPVTGWLFTEMKIDRIVINSLTFRQMEGQPWIIGFDMDCESDASPELEIHSGLEIKRVL